jgi:FkbM family methyltransferase
MISNYKNQGNEFRSIVVKDVYGVKKYRSDYFDVIFDIGANIGFFSIYMRMKHPYTRIVAVEPNIEVCNYLRQNINMLNIELEEKALGSGERFFLLSRGHILDSMFVPECEGDSYSVESISLVSLFEKYNCKLSDRYLIKFNCEGGEKYIVGDRKSEEVLTNAQHIGIQIHFKSQKTPFDNWLSREEYDDWINHVFKDTHDVTEHRRNMNRGISFYWMVKKN